jgi:acetylornithine/succinyldiaminopimelate/putrescine aminotransferase
VVPDLIVLAKALGGGMPLGAFAGRPSLMRTLSEDPPLAHVTTFGGHPVSCAAGLTALAILERDRLVDRASALGDHMLQRLRALIGRGGLATVRGLGLLIGLEFASADSCARFVARAWQQRLILNWTLHQDTVVRLTPPLTLSDEEAEEALTRIATALT